jgi:rubredoxin
MSLSIRLVPFAVSVRALFEVCSKCGDFARQPLLDFCEPGFDLCGRHRRATLRLDSKAIIEFFVSVASCLPFKTIILTALRTKNCPMSHVLEYSGVIFPRRCSSSCEAGQICWVSVGMRYIQQQGLLHGCSECGWVFKPSGPPVGKTLEEMKRNFLQQLDKEFESHNCNVYPRRKSATGQS